jgi:hypothetical protein
MAAKTPNLPLKATMLVVALVMVMAALIPGPGPAQACQSFTDFWTYFSNASHTTVVGRCEKDCGCAPRFCSGQQTQYYIVTTSSGCL